MELSHFYQKNISYVFVKTPEGKIPFEDVDMNRREKIKWI
jgi:hypothetical protein